MGLVPSSRHLAVKVVAEGDAVHHLVETGVAGNLTGVGEVELVEAGTNFQSLREADLYADGLVQGEVDVGSIRRESLLGVGDNTSFGGEEGLEHLAFAPEHAEADGRDGEAGDGGEGVAERVAVLVFDARLAKERER